MDSSQIYYSTADLTLWFKTQAGDNLSLSDIPKLIPLRWAYFRDNWEFLKEQLETSIDSYENKDLLLDQLNEFTDFIDVQKTSNAKTNPFSDSIVFFRYYTVFDIIDLNLIPLNNDEQTIIENEINRVKQFTKNDFIKIKKNLQKVRDEFADTVGTSDPDYNRIFNRSSVPKQTNLTTVDVLKMQQFMNGIKSVEYILANIFTLNTAYVDPFALAKLNANNPEIDFDAYKSGKLVRLNYGEDLQSLASRYLGSPDKWIDIAIANGLKPPYVDEVGEAISLISNGNGNKINISGTGAGGTLNIDKVYINQPVVLQSDIEKFPEQRVVTNITEVPVSGEIILELSGNDDLDKYQIADAANLRVFRPNTVNSGLYVLIPSLTPLDEDFKQDTPWFLQTKGEDEKRAKIDLRLGENNDLVLNSTNDIQLSYGLENAIQAIKLKFNIEQGSLIRHQDFGFPTSIGASNRDPASNKAAIIQAINSMIEKDARFSRVERLDVNDIEGSASGYIISLVVRLAGSQGSIPISFVVNIDQN